mmetsp:Transcript_63543/g.148198  ORF Transcript_63543/g.148198 Transcript_63543/m.148198 type:complete len:274 (-) Transcript_63543:859-1680(-)
MAYRSGYSLDKVKPLIRDCNVAELAWCQHVHNLLEGCAHHPALLWGDPAQVSTSAATLACRLALGVLLAQLREFLRCHVDELSGVLRSLLARFQVLAELIHGPPKDGFCLLAAAGDFPALRIFLGSRVCVFHQDVPQAHALCSATRGCCEFGLLRRSGGLRSAAGLSLLFTAWPGGQEANLNCGALCQSCCSCASLQCSRGNLAACCSGLHLELTSDVHQFTGAQRYGYRGGHEEQEGILVCTLQRDTMHLRDAGDEREPGARAFCTLPQPVA